MKYLFCIDEDKDLQRMQMGQIESLTEDSDSVVTVSVGKHNQKEQILEALSTIEDEYIVFVPTNNLLVDKINYKKIEDLATYCKNNDFDYCRLRRLGASKINTDSDIHVDTCAIFFLCPHVIKKDKMEQIVSKVSRNGPMFWLSLETTDLDGCFYFTFKDQDNHKGFSYWVPSIMHTLTEIIDHNEKWSTAYINFNKKILSTKIAEYNIDMEDRGVDEITSDGCCI